MSEGVGTWHCRAPWSPSEETCIVHVGLKNAVRVRKLRSGHALSALLVHVREKWCHLTSPAAGCAVLQYFGP